MAMTGRMAASEKSGRHPSACHRRAASGADPRGAQLAKSRYKQLAMAEHFVEMALISLSGGLEEGLERRIVGGQLRHR